MGERLDRLMLHGDPGARRVRADRRARRRARGEPLRVLVTSGGFGVGPIAKVVRSFAGIGGVELTVVCGRAEKLVARVERRGA